MRSRSWTEQPRTRSRAVRRGPQGSRSARRAPVALRSALALRNGELKTLREISHKLFRGERSDPFDNHATNIYHEVSILKEEEWTLREQATSGDPKEFERYYREVNFYYPKRLRHVRNLYGKARKRLEKILPTMGRNTIVIRSAYLFGGELFAGVYERGLEEFYEYLYPAGGALTGYSVVAIRSMRAASARRRRGYERARAATRERPASRPGRRRPSRHARSLDARRRRASRSADGRSAPVTAQSVRAARLRRAFGCQMNSSTASSPCRGSRIRLWTRTDDPESRTCSSTRVGATRASRVWSRLGALRERKARGPRSPSP
jgi:hypothetical protein